MLFKVTGWLDGENLPDMELFDILRCIMEVERCSFIGRLWSVSDIERSTYPASNSSEGISGLFPEKKLVDFVDRTVVSAERLLERASSTLYFELGLFLRLRAGDDQLVDDYHADWKIDDCTFHSANVDLEIRCVDTSGYAVLTEDPTILDRLIVSFAGDYMQPKGCI